jgi:hypothetical protein
VPQVAEHERVAETAVIATAAPDHRDATADSV